MAAVFGVVMETNPADAGVLPLAASAFLARQLRPLREIPFQYSLDDHGPQHYIAALTPKGRPAGVRD